MGIQFTSANLDQQKAVFAGKAVAPSKAAVVKSAKVSAPISTGDYRQIDLAALKLDQSAQPRETVNNDKIAEYADAMKAGDKFPALVVFEDETGIWLADGFHRHYAAQHAGIKTMSCRVMPGGLRDAILYSVGANATHGVPRSDEDKRRAVTRLLDDAEWTQWSDNDIRKKCKVSLSFVQKLRKAPSYREVRSEAVPAPPTVPDKVKERAAAIEAAGGVPRYFKRGVTVAVMDTAGINAGRKPATPEPLPVKASEPVAVELPATPPRIIFDEFVALWSEATPEDREAFIGYLRIIGYRVTESSAGERPVEATDVEHRSDGDTVADHKESGDVDRSAERASSAVKVGARNSNPKPISSPVTDRPASNSSPTSAAPRQPLSKADQIRLLRPQCKHPDDLEKCAGNGRTHCRDCMPRSDGGLNIVTRHEGIAS